MTSGKNQSKLPKWFKGELYPKGDTVKNPFSGEICELNAEELSMYDFIVGAQAIFAMGNIESEVVRDFERALHWFRKNNAKAYMILLD